MAQDAQAGVMWGREEAGPVGCLALASSKVTQTLNIISLTLMLSYWGFGPWLGGPLSDPYLWWRLCEAIIDVSVAPSFHVVPTSLRSLSSLGLI